MFRKFSVFVDSYLVRRVAEEGVQSKLQMAFANAVAFPGEILRLYLTSFGREEELPEGMKPLYKYLSFGYAEYNYLEDGFKKANRIEAVLNIFAENTISVDMHFYPRGMKVAPFVFMLKIGPTGVVGGISCMIHNPQTSEKE